MIQLSLQFFGGRGAAAEARRRQRRGIQLRPGKSNQSPVVGPNVASTLKDAIGTKGARNSIAESLRNTNPNWNGKYDAFSSNCQRCIVAYELNRRGYDVTALPTYAGDTLPQIAYRDKKDPNNLIGRWQGAFQKAKGERVGVAGNNKAAEEATIKNIQDKMKGFGSGSRAVVQILYRGGGGHVFNVENVNGNIMFVEAQTGKNKDIWNTMKGVKTESVRLVRTDNLKISDRARKFVTQK